MTILPEVHEKPNQEPNQQLSSERFLIDPNASTAVADIRNAAFSAFAQRKNAQEKAALDALNEARQRQAQTLVNKLADVFEPLLIQTGWDTSMDDVSFPGDGTGDSLRPVLKIAGLDFTLRTTSEYASRRESLVIEFSCDQPGCQNPQPWHSEEIQCLADVGAALVSERSRTHSCSDDNPWEDN